MYTLMKIVLTGANGFIGAEYFLFPKITPYREMNAAMDMVIGKQCNNVFIGCGGSSFSDILLHRITGDNIQKYLC